MNIAYETLENQTKKTDFTKEINFEEESGIVRTLNSFIDINEIFQIEFNEKYLIFWINYHNFFLNYILNVMNDKKSYLFKHLELLGEELRNLYVFYTYFFNKNLLVGEVIRSKLNKNIDILKGFYRLSTIINKDVLSQVSLLIMFDSFRMKKVKNKF